VRRPATPLLGLAALVLGGVLAWLLFAGPGGPDAASVGGGPEGRPAPDAVGAEAAGEAAGAEVAPDRDVDRASVEDVAAGAGADAAAGLATLRLRLVDGDGHPVAGVAVEAKGADASVRGVSDAAGRVVLRVPPLAALRLTTDAATWWAPAQRVSTPPAGGEQDLGPWALAPTARLEVQVRDPEGAPVADAVVRLLPSRDGGAFGWSGGFEAFGVGGGARATTDEAGRAELSVETEGRFRLVVEAAGFPPKTVEGIRPAHGAEAPRVEVALEPGRTLTGRVVDADRRPVAGASVWLRLVGAEAVPFSGFLLAAGPSDDGVTTDDEGRFRLGGLPDDGGPEAVHAVVLARAPGVGEGLLAWTPDLRDPVVVLRPRASLQGRVLDPEGAPVADALVRARLEAREGWGDWNDSWETRTDAEGSFRFDDLPPEPLRVLAEAGARRSAELAVDPTRPGATLELRLGPAAGLTLRFVDVGGRPVPGVEVRLTRPGADRAEKVQIVFDDADEVPLEDASASAVEPRVSDEEGRAHWPALADGEWTARAVAPDGTTFVHPFTRSIGLQEEEVVVPEPGFLVVEAADSAGEPVVGLELTVTAAETDGLTRTATTDAVGRAAFPPLAPGAWELRHRAEADDGGGAVILFMEPEEEDAPAEADAVERLVVRPGEVLVHRLVLDALAQPVVRVVRHGAGVPGVRIRVRRPNAGAGIWESGAGRYRTDGRGEVVLPPLPPGRWEVAATPPGEAPPTSVEVELGPGRHEVEVRLSGAVVEGVVSDGSGPVAGAEVSLSAWQPPGEDEDSRAQGVAMVTVVGADGGIHMRTVTAGSSRTTIRSDTEGRWRFEDVPPGRWQVTAEAPERAPAASAPVVVEGGGAVEVPPLVLSPGAVIRGRVRGWTPLPPDAPDDEVFSHGWQSSVQLLRGGRLLEVSLPDAEGRYRFAGLAAGAYSVTLIGKPPVEVEVGPGEEVVVDVGGD